MKRGLGYILAFVFILTLLACSNNKMDDEGLTDKEKLELLDAKIEKHPKDASLYASRAMLLMNLGRTLEATADIEKAVSIEPRNVEYHLRQADVYFARGDVEKSYKALSEAEQLAPENMEVQLKMGEVTFYSRDYDRSLKCLSKVTEKEPDNRTALFMTGFIYKEKGDTLSAVQLLRRVCDLYPDYSPAFEELGVLYASHNNPLAEEYLGTVIQMDSTNTNALYALAMYHQDRGEMDAAENLYQRIVGINPRSADSWHNLGYIEMTYYHDYKRAIELFDSALTIDPYMESALHNQQVAREAMK